MSIRFARSLARRLANRTPRDAKPEKPCVNALAFESLEPRLLLAADPLGITAGYAFNESSGTTTVDVSGHGITGTLTSGAAFTTAGKNGNAVALDGVNDYVNLGNPTALRLTGSMTVSAWIYSTAFPGDDAAIVSKRNASEMGFQLDTTVDKGPRTIGFKLTNSSGGEMYRYGATALQANTWYYVTGVYNASAQTLDVYLNGVLDNGVLQGTITTSQQNPTNNNVTVGRRSGMTGFAFIGRIDDVRIADHALTQDQIQTDMVTPLGGVPPADTIAPIVALTSPATTAVSGTVSVAATASDNFGVAGLQFLLDNASLGTEDATSPYSISWNTTTATNGTHTLGAQARDAAGNTTTTSITITVDNQVPSGTVVINSGAAATNTTAVTLTLSATDALSGISQMRFSNNGTSFSTAENFAATKAWTLTTGAGTKTVYVQFRDGAGNWSASVTDTIVLDTTAPTVSARTATNITANAATVTWTTNEPATSQVDFGLTTGYGSTTTLDPVLVTAHSVVLSGLAPSTTYNYRVRSVDAAGNQTVSANSTFTTAAGADTVAPSIPTGLAGTPVSTTQINLSWNASTDNVGVTGYQVFRDGQQIATTATTSYSNTTGLSPDTTYAYAVLAVDAAGNTSAQSAPVSATTLVPDATVPDVTMTAPANSATVSGIVTVSANASDNVGVAGVQFLLDGVALGNELTAGPYSLSWDTTTVGNGNHSLLARARDAAGNTKDSLVVAVTVSNTQVMGLVAAYAFDEGTGTTTSDASSGGITGTLVNGAAFGPGKYGNGLVLDGANDYVDLGNPTGLRLTGSMTISAWINSATFPADDAAIVSKRAGGESGFQLDTTIDKGTRTIGFKLTNSSGGAMYRYGATTLQANTWYYVTGVYNATAQTLDVYLNGQLDNGVLQGTITASQQNSSADVNLGRRPGASGFEFSGRIDDVRIYSRALTLSEIQANMVTPIGSSEPVELPEPHIESPIDGAQVSNILTVTTHVHSDVAIVAVQLFVDGTAATAEDTTDPYGFTWDTRTVTNGVHTLTARARDINGNIGFSDPVTVNVANTSHFVNEILATGFDLPTTMVFLPDGKMLVAELGGTIRLVLPPYTQIQSTPFFQISNLGRNGVEQGLYDIAIDPNFATNHYIYVSYTLGTPNHDRLSRFTVNAASTGVVAGSELVLYEDTQNSGADHHGGAIMFGNDGKIYFATGDDLVPAASQSLSSPRGKILRINPDGTVPTDNPFYDGAGPNYDAIWALGLRNPFRAFYDAATGQMFIGDVGGNDWNTAIEELNLGIRGANYGWPNVEAPNGNPAYTAPIYYYTHIVNGTPRDASITAGFVYRGTQFPAAYQGNLFFADYVQNWIKRATLDSSGNITGVFNFEPLDGALDGAYGDIVKMVQGPEGALYYVDIGFSDQNVGPSIYGLSKIRRISFVDSNLPPIVAASANPTQGQTPLTVNFSSAGSSDPEGQPVTYLWTFGDGTTSTQANPTHVYSVAGPYQARLSVSDGANTSFSPVLSINAGNAPVATVLAPTNGISFRAGDVITFSGAGTDTDDGALPASAYAWNIDFLHETHVHPGTPITGVTSGTFVIPTAGHDFSGFTRYRITLTVTDSSGLKTSSSVIINPEKVNLTFNAVPTGTAIYLDGIAHTAPFVYDTLIGFNHTIEARNQTVGGTTYNFASWSDGGAQLHTVVVPAAAQTYTATYNVVSTPAPLAFVQVNAAVPQTPQSTVTVAYTSAQTAGNTNILVIGWNDTTSNITSVTDSAGNVYQVAVPTVRGPGPSQAIYYASNINAAPAGTNTITVTFNTAAPFVDLRALEYSVEKTE